MLERVVQDAAARSLNGTMILERRADFARDGPAMSHIHAQGEEGNADETGRIFPVSLTRALLRDC